MIKYLLDCTIWLNYYRHRLISHSLSTHFKFDTYELCAYIISLIKPRIHTLHAVLVDAQKVDICMDVGTVGK